MPSLGSLWYTVGLKDLTDADIQKINDKLTKAGSDLTITPKLAQTLDQILPKSFTVDITPNKVAQEALDKAAEGKVMHTEILPLADKLKDAVVNTLKGMQVPLDGVTIPPDKLTASVTQALASVNFTSLGESAGDTFSKAVALKVEKQPYYANVTVKPDKIVTVINDALAKIEKKDRKIKLDKSAITEFRNELEKSLKDKVTVTPTLNLTQDAIQRAVEGKVMKIEVMPLLTHLRKALLDATTQSPAQIEVGPDAVKLRNLVTNVLTSQGFMVSITTVTGLEKSIRDITENGRVYDVTLRCDPALIVQSVRTALSNMQSDAFGLVVSRDILRKSIDDALGAAPFQIQLQVLRDQARQAVQTALNGVSNVSPRDASTYEKLMRGDKSAARAELDRTRTAHLRAADAARTHASASISLGGALGSNIRIAGELGSAMASLYSVHALKQFLAQVIEIGGELEHQKIAMDTIFGDKGKTTELFGQIKGLARQSPFGVMELTKSVKALSAYGVQYNEIYDTAKRLADISAATSVDINRLILAFGKTKSRGFLDGLEAKQFAYANIPIYEMVRKKLEEVEGQAITTADVMKRIKKREIGFDMVKEVLWDITDKGGKFYNMQEALAGSVKTSWKLVRDNIDLMFGEIAESKIGDVLKGIAVALQGLTRNWGMMGAAISSAVAVLGISKIATLGLNRIMSQGIDIAGRDLLVNKKKEAARLRLAALTRTLTAEEAQLVRTSNRVTAEDLKKAYARNKLSAGTVKMLYLTKQLDAAEIQRLVTMKMIDAQTAKSIVKTNAFSRSMAALGMNIKGIWKSAGMALSGIFNWTTAILAAIGGVMMLVERSREDSRKAKEIADNFFIKASEGADNMKKTLESIKSPEGLSDLQLKQGIEEMQQVIKDYSPTPIKDINKALIDQNGHVRSLTEQYQNLKSTMESLSADFNKAANPAVSDSMNKAIERTKTAFWNDGLAKQYKDIESAQKDMRNHILDYMKDNKSAIRDIVKAAQEESPEFAEATKGMIHDSEKFMELAMNYSKYWKSISDTTREIIKEADNAPGSLAELWGNIVTLNRLNAAGRYEEADRKAKEAASRFVQLFESELELHRVEWSGFSEQAKRMIYNSAIDGLELSPEMAARLRLDLKDLVGFDLTEADPIGEELRNQLKQITSKTGQDLKEFFESLGGEFGTLAKNEGAEGCRKLLQSALNTLQYEGYESLTGAAKNLVDKIMAASSTNARQNLGKTVEEMDTYLSNNPLTQFVNIVFQYEKQPSAIQQEIWDAHDTVHTELLNPKKMEWYRSWTNGAEGYADVSKNAAASIQKVTDEIKAIKNASPEWMKKKREELTQMKELANSMGLNYKLKNEKSSSKDTIAEALKQRFKDIKDAWSEFQKWAKTEGKEAAFKRIGDSGIFSTLSADEIPQTVEQYRALVVKIEDELRKAGIAGHSQRESLLNELLKQLLEIDKTVIDEQLKLSLDKVSEEAERQLENWTLFDRLYKATGDKKMAANFAFGIGVTAETDYPAMIKKQLRQTVAAAESTLAKAFPKDGESPYQIKGYTYESLKSLYDARDTDEGLTEWMAVPEEIRKAWENANGSILKYLSEQRDKVADLLTEYQSMQEKLAQIDSEREDNLKLVGESETLTPERKEDLTRRINVKADYEKFTKSNEYLRFFNDIYGMTMTEANRIGDLIQLNLNKELQASLISIHEYEEEMKKVREQLETLRNVKSDALTYLTGGVKGLNEKKLNKAEGELANNKEYKKALEEQIAWQVKLNKAKEEGNAEGIAAAEAQLKTINEQITGLTAFRDLIVKDTEKWENMVDVAGVVANIAKGISDAFNTLRDMAESFGFDTESGAWETAASVIDTLTTVTSGVQGILQSVMNGDIGGVISNAFSTLLTPITIWNKLHDKKLQRDIELSKKRYNQYDRLVSAIERRLDEHLGAYVDFDPLPGTQYGEDGAFGYQRELKKQQLEELKRQQADLEDMKNRDEEAIEDMKADVAELADEIANLQIEAANSIYGIDIPGYAETLGDALWDAFMQGTDAAEAFDKAVADIMSDVVKNILKVNILERAFQNVKDWLASEDGPMGDGILDTNEAYDMWGMIQDAAKTGMDNWNAAMEAMPEDMKQYLKENAEDATSGASAGIQSVTEDTADLIASYINAIRADVSIATNIHWPKLLNEFMPQLSVIAQQQLSIQGQIAENTLRNAVAAEAIVKSNDDISRLLTRVTQGGAKFYVQ